MANSGSTFQKDVNVGRNTLFPTNSRPGTLIGMGQTWQLRNARAAAEARKEAEELARTNFLRRQQHEKDKVDARLKRSLMENADRVAQQRRAETAAWVARTRPNHDMNDSYVRYDTPHFTEGFGDRVQTIAKGIVRLVLTVVGVLTVFFVLAAIANAH